MEKTIKIGGITYRVLEEEGLMEKHELFGLAAFGDSSISVEKNIPSDRKENVLVHEVLHAIFYESGYDPEEQEEEMIRRVGNVLHQVLKDNPDGFWRVP